MLPCTDYAGRSNESIITSKSAGDRRVNVCTTAPVPSPSSEFSGRAAQRQQCKHGLLNEYELAPGSFIK